MQILQQLSATAKLTKFDNLSDPDILAFEIIENIDAGLASFKEIMEEIKPDEDKAN